MNPWILSQRFDLSFLLLPGFLSVVIVIFGNEFGVSPSHVSPVMWLLLVVLIDVCHVWSTLFRTYLNKYSNEEFEKELFLIPFAVWVSGTIICSISSTAFWTLLAYTAVFHFLKQQVGILKIYCQKSKQLARSYTWDIFFTYSLMLIPIVYWHLTPREFHWFTPTDFFKFNTQNIDFLIPPVYLTLILIHLIKEYNFRSDFNLPKNIHILSTGLVWFFGIIYYNNDWTFTLTNVVHHGIPYFALVWASCLRGDYTTSPRFFQVIFKKKIVIRTMFFLGLLFCLGYGEELLWDIFVWHDNDSIFPKSFYVELSDITLVWLVPLLTLPQATHYILDGVIWKRNRKTKEFAF
ncbi:MAG: hypothetical protein ACJAS4_000407 [Bacteriovoracaceae bacterium]